jgi:hypothetical protein
MPEAAVLPQQKKLPAERRRELLEWGKDTKARCMTDTLFLLHDVCDYPSFQPIFHERMAQAAMYSWEHGGKDLQLWPRGHLKTTICTVGERLRRALVNGVRVHQGLEEPKRFCIASFREDNAIAFLRVIRDILETNTLLRELFPEVIPTQPKWRKQRWTNHSIYLKQWTSRGKEPTFSVASVETGVTSRHFDDMCADDLVTAESVKSQAIQDAVKQWYRRSYHLLEPEHTYTMVGNFWRIWDLYHWIMKNEKGQWHREVHNCWAENGEPAFGRKFTRSVLDEHRARDPQDFAAQYENAVVGTDLADFDPAWVVECKASLLPKWWSWYLGVDPNTNTVSTADFCGFAIEVVSPEDKRFVVRSWGVRPNPDELINILFDLHRQYGFRRMFIEHEARDTLKYWVDKAQRQRGTRLPITWVKPGRSKGAKASRIRRLIPGVKGGWIAFDREGCRELVGDKSATSTEGEIGEMFVWPHGGFDDRLDALAIADMNARKPPVRETRDHADETVNLQPVVVSTGETVERFQQRIRKHGDKSGRAGGAYV